MFTLEELTTSDGLIHQGIVARPHKPTTKAVLWIHGLSGAFYGSAQLLKALATQVVEEGIVFASFNTRGHDGVTGIKKRIQTNGVEESVYVNGGAGHEVFTECIHDIQGGIDFLKGQGIHEVILVGHSTGTNKVNYYMSQGCDTTVEGVVLLSPVSDRLAPDVDQQKLKEDIVMMNTLVASHKGDGLVVGKAFFPLTPKRYVSLYVPGPEDQYDYDKKEPKLPYFSTIEQPVFVVLGEFDEYLDRPAREVLNAFKKLTGSKVYTDMVVLDANHGYKGKEKEVSLGILDWIRSL